MMTAFSGYEKTLYELLDEPARGLTKEAHFGMYDSAGNLKPIANTIKTLLA
jgi:hypothetical protein